MSRRSCSRDAGTVRERHGLRASGVDKRRDHLETVRADSFEVDRGVLVTSSEWRSVTESATDDLLPRRSIHSVPGVEIHGDPADHQGAPALEPGGTFVGPDDVGEVLRAWFGIGGPVDLAHEVAGRRECVSIAEAALNPAHLCELPAVLEEHAGRMSDRRGVVPTDVHEDVATAPPGARVGRWAGQESR